jgi:hypothetical protein
MGFAFLASDMPELPLLQCNTMVDPTPSRHQLPRAAQGTANPRGVVPQQQAQGGTAQQVPNHDPGVNMTSATAGNISFMPDSLDPSDQGNAITNSQLVQPMTLEQSQRPHQRQANPHGARHQVQAQQGQQRVLLDSTRVYYWRWRGSRWQADKLEFCGLNGWPPDVPTTRGLPEGTTVMTGPVGSGGMGMNAPRQALICGGMGGVGIDGVM